MDKELRKLTFYDDGDEILEEKLFENEKKAKEYVKEMDKRFGKVHHKLKKVKVH